MLVVTYHEDPGRRMARRKPKSRFSMLAATPRSSPAVRRITGENTHMDVKANTVTVQGNVKVVQGKTIITGQRLFSNLDTNKSEISGGRVKGNFVPGK